MKDTAPASKGTGVIVVSCLFGLIAAGVAFVAFGYGAVPALFIGGIIAAAVAIVLMLGWREPAEGPMGVVERQSEPAPTVSASAAPATPAPAAAAPAEAPAVEAPPAAAAEAPATETAQPATSSATVKSTQLAGETELADRKGEWKYDGPGGDADPTPTAETKPAPAPTAAPAGEASKPEFLSEAREGGPDDLKQIKGVGPKLENTLHEMGLFHFDQIASWGPAEQAWMDENLTGFKGRATRDDWVGQAKVLAAGGETEFSKKVDKGGVY